MSDKKKRPRGRPKGRPKKGKMTAAESLLFRKEATKKILAEHLSHKDFVYWCMTNYNLSRPSGESYWKKCWKDIRQRFSLDREKLINKHLDKYWLIHDTALENDDLNTARQALNDIAKLQGLNEPEKVDINQNATIEFKFGDES